MIPESLEEVLERWDKPEAEEHHKNLMDDPNYHDFYDDDNKPKDVTIGRVCSIKEDEIGLVVLDYDECWVRYWLARANIMSKKG